MDHNNSFFVHYSLDLQWIIGNFKERAMLNINEKKKVCSKNWGDLNAHRTFYLQLQKFKRICLLLAWALKANPLYHRYNRWVIFLKHGWWPLNCFLLRSMCPSATLVISCCCHVPFQKHKLNFTQKKRIWSRKVAAMLLTKPNQKCRCLRLWNSSVTSPPVRKKRPQDKPDELVSCVESLNLEYSSRTEDRSAWRSREIKETREMLLL